MRGSTFLIFILSALGAVVLTIYLVNTVFDNEVLEEPKPALPYDSVVADSVSEPAVLNEDTDILGLTVYDAHDDVIGKLYDVYAEPGTGTVQWISVDVQSLATDTPEAQLILVSVDTVTEMNSNGPIVINTNRADFFELPYQQKREERLESLVSLRELPESAISDEAGGPMAVIDRVSYAGGALDTVYFTASEKGFYGKTGSFAVPFQSLKFNPNADNPGSWSFISMSERQAGMVEAYLKDKD